MSWAKQHLFSFVLALNNNYTFLLHFSSHLGCTPLFSIHLYIPLEPLWIGLNHIFELMHLDNYNIDGFTHSKPDSAPALINPHVHLLILFAVDASIIKCWVLVEAQLIQVEALLELVLAELVAIGAYLHNVVEWRAEQLFTQGDLLRMIVVLLLPTNRFLREGTGIVVEGLV